MIEVRRPAHPDYPPPAFVDGRYLSEVEGRAARAEEAIAVDLMEGVRPDRDLEELVLADVPAMAAEIRRLRALLGWTP